MSPSLRTEETEPSLDNKVVSRRAWRQIDLAHWCIIMIVFGITGVLAATFSRLLLNGVLHIQGNMWSGPWSYRLIYILCIPPSYSVILLLVGSLFGKHSYFKRRIGLTWGRLLPRRVRRMILD